jgi:hypothetical protein
VDTAWWWEDLISLIFPIELAGTCWSRNAPADSNLLSGAPFSSQFLLSPDPQLSSALSLLLGHHERTLLNSKLDHVFSLFNLSVVWSLVPMHLGSGSLAPMQPVGFMLFTPCMLACHAPSSLTLLLSREPRAALLLDTQPQFHSIHCLLSVDWDRCHPPSLGVPWGKGLCPSQFFPQHQAQHLAYNSYPA